MIPYALTMGPGLSWANNGADGGDLITAAYTGGVAHPSGYPTYLILARLFQCLPFGTLAFRTNLMSSVFMILTCILIFYMIRVIYETSEIGKGSWLAGILAALAFGWSSLAWSQSVITEVYTLHIFFICLVLFLLIKREKSIDLAKKKRLDCMIGLSLGLALGNQVTSIALLPVIFLISMVSQKNLQQGEIRKGFFQRRQWHIDWQILLIRLNCLLIGLLIYLTLPVRALFNSPVNWGNPESLKGFFWLVSGQIYQTNIQPPQVFFSTLSEGAQIILSQLGIAGLVLALFGMFFYRRVSKQIYMVSAYLAVFFFLFFLFYHTDDSSVYLLPFILVLAIWFGLGSGKLITVVFYKYRLFGIITGLAIFLYLVGLAFITMPKVDASQNMQAEQFSQELLQSAPEHALVITSQDRDSFALWYHHFALHERQDLRILVTGLTQFDWYRETLKKTYPDLIIPDTTTKIWTQAIILSNLDRPLCYTFMFDTWLIHCTEPVLSD